MVLYDLGSIAVKSSIQSTCETNSKYFILQAVSQFRVSQLTMLDLLLRRFLTEPEVSISLQVCPCCFDSMFEGK